VLPIYKRSVVGTGGVVINAYFDFVAGIPNLNDRALFDEQPGEINCFGKRSTTVITKVNYQTVDLFRLKFANEFLNISRSTCVVGITFSVFVKIHVEAW